MIVITSWRRLALLVVIIGLGVAVLGRLVIWGSGSIRHSGELVVPEGAAAQHVWEKMVAEDFTKRTLPWRYHAWRLDAASRLKSGTYQLTAGESIAAVVERLIKGEVLSSEQSITFPEGFTLNQMAARVEAEGLSSAAEFTAAATTSTAFIERFPFVAEVPPGRTLEGYLFPDTYRIAADDTATDLVNRQLATFAERVPPDLRAEAVSRQRTLDEIVIMASIIEREVISDKDMSMVAGVLWKRADEGAGLAADATIRYALNKWDESLTYDDLRVDSPYNTRRYRGLPPGPISNPGLRAITAAIRPQESEYYYYLSTPDGETIFSRTNDEHNANKAKYLR